MSFSCTARLVAEVVVAFVLLGVPLLVPQRRAPIPFERNNPAHAFPSTPSGWPYPVVLVVGTAAVVVAAAVAARKHDSFRFFVVSVTTYICAASATKCLTDVLKRMIGRPRPCAWALVDAGRTDNAFRSFPSGHSSTVFCAMLFTTLVLWSAFARGRRSLLRLAACCAPMGFAVLVAVSRLVEFHHHYDDVVAGALIGSAIAGACFATRLGQWASPPLGLP